MDKELHNYTIAVVPAGLTAQMKHVKGVNHASTASRFGKKIEGNIIQRRFTRRVAARTAGSQAQV